MRGSEYQELLATLPHGKRLPTAIYIHRDALAASKSAAAEFVERLAQEHQMGSEFNLIKFRVDVPKITFLCYPKFFEEAHPALAHSMQVDLLSGKVRKTDYAENANPPILHRKETFLAADHPRRGEFADLSAAEEEAGLYENPTTIGFKLNWQRLLESKGLTCEGHSLARRSVEAAQPPKAVPAVDRHKTALTRFDLSKPVKTLFEHGLLKPGVTLFDYGCGPGSDVAGLKSMGHDADGWDPVFRPDVPKKAADIVNLGYVLNVIVSGHSN